MIILRKVGKGNRDPEPPQFFFRNAGISCPKRTQVPGHGRGSTGHEVAPGIVREGFYVVQQCQYANRIGQRVAIHRHRRPETQPVSPKKFPVSSIQFNKGKSLEQLSRSGFPGDHAQVLHPMDGGEFVGTHVSLPKRVEIRILQQGLPAAVAIAEATGA